METKAVQAVWSGHRREAWSADQRQQRYHSWRFNRRNIPTKEHEEFTASLDDRRYGYDIHGPAAAPLGVRGHEDRQSLHSLPAQHMRARDGPTVIYTRELQDLQRQADNRHRDTIYLEDIEGMDYPPPGHIIDHRQVRGGVVHREVRINAEEDRDTDSMRRHEVERGSDLGRGGEYRRGDVHREVDNGDREYHFVLHRGNHQRLKHSDGDEDDPQNLSTAVQSRREQFYIRDGNAEILRLVTRGRSGDEQEFAQVGPQPQQRPMTLVPPRQQHHSVRVDNGKEIIMQRFMEDQRNNSSQQAEGGREEEAPDAALLTSLHQQDLLVRRLLEEEARLNNTLLLTEALVAQRQHEQFLATAEENIETQSLPGQTSMATQTDVDSSTQTEPMHLMRPPRRRARSDNDDSFTEEEDKDNIAIDENSSLLNASTGAVHGFWIKKHRTKRKRNSLTKRVGGKSVLAVPGKRHKIKTPIMEETESALEAAERQTSESQDHIPGGNYTDNKTSLLRRRNSKAKIATTSGEMEVTSIPNTRKNELEDVEEETPTDSLEERSPTKKRYTSDDNRERSYRYQTPKTISVSVGDARKVDIEGSRRSPFKKHHVGFRDSDTLGSSSERRRDISDARRDSLSDQGRIRASSYAPSSDSTSGRRSELESSTETRDNDKQAIPEIATERERSSLHGSRSETGVKPLGSTRPTRRNSVPNERKFEAKNRLSRRGSMSEPGRLEDDVLNLSQRQTIASRAKSLNQINTVGKSRETRRGSLSGPAPKRGSRYMEWYKSKREERERKKREEEEAKREKPKKKYKPARVAATDSKVAKNRENEKRGSMTEDRGARRPIEVDVDKELEKAEEQVLKVTVFDDDMDSGIAMSSMLMGGGGKKKRGQHLLEKKSVFTIAYDDMQTKQLRPDSSSPQY